MKHKTLDDETSDGATTQEQHHGDLRKGAYLKRRAEYQMQANASRMAQAGTLLTAPATTPGDKDPHR